MVKSNKRFSRKSKRRSKLQIERLEQRQLLSSVPVLVDDTNSLTESSQADLRNSVTIEDITYFSADDGIHGKELWRTDRTESGTWMVKDLNPDLSQYYSNAGTPQSSAPSQLVNAGGTLYFMGRAGGNRTTLFESISGTAADTQEVTGVPANLNVSSISGLTVVGSKLFFSATEVDATAYKLWVKDGASINNLTDLNSAAGGINSRLREKLFNVNGKLIFWGDNGSGGSEMWSSDGTEANTVQITDLNPLPSQTFAYPYLGEQMLIKDLPGGDRLYFTGWQEGDNVKLWVTDGTLSGTQVLGGHVPTNMANVDGLLYFQTYESGYGYELWSSDGTPENTKRVTDMNPGSASSSPHQIVGLGTTAFFRARTGTSPTFGYWKTDGTSVEPVLLLPERAGGFTAFGNYLYFTGDDPTLGNELFKVDAAGDVSPPIDVWPGENGSAPRYLTEVAGKLMFLASSGTGRAMWISEGDISTTNIVKDINQNTDGSSSRILADLNGLGYFVPSHGEFKGELLSTDGTPGGTQQLTDLHFANGINELTRVGNALFFTARPEGSSREGLWKYENGTTQLVKGDFSPGSLREFNGRLYFGAQNSVGNHVLWTSNGTPEGTRVFGSNIPGRFIDDIGGDLFFNVDVTSSYALHRTDGGVGETGGQIDSVVVQPDNKLVAVGRVGGVLMVIRYNSDGSIDTSFGDNGRVIDTDLGRSYGKAVIQSDGKIVVGSYTISDREIAVVRLLSDGSYDLSFGVGGTSVVPLPGNDNEVSSLALQGIPGQEKVIISTTSIIDPSGPPHDYNFVVVRLNDDGTLDTTFGDDADLDGTPDGYTITDVAGEGDYPTTVLVSLADQKILLVGGAETSGVWENTVLRYSADGILDATYGTGGIVTVPNTGGQFEAAIVLDDGSVIATGDSVNSGSGNSYVMKFDPDGNLDTTFGDTGTGIVFVNSGGVGEGIVELPDHSLVIATQNSGVVNPPASMFKLSATGQLDTTFGDSGIVTTRFGEVRGQAWTLSVQPHPTNGQPHLILAGSGYNGSTSRWGMARMDTSGTLDTSFGNAGIVSTGVGTRKFLDDMADSGITRVFTPVASGENLYFQADHPTLGRQLWVLTNGAAAPVALTSSASIGATGYVHKLVDVGGTLFFHVQRGNEMELWKSNSTVNGTQLVAVIEDTEYTNVKSHAVVGGNYYFTVGRDLGDDFGGLSANGLWMSDGTSTQIVDTAPIPNPYYGGDLIGSLKESGGKLYYQRYEPSTGIELWSHDGAASTRITDIDPGAGSSYPIVYDLAGETFMRATSRQYGSELWHLLDDTDPATTPTVTISAGTSGTVNISRIEDDLVVSKGGIELSRYQLGTIVALTVQGAPESEVFAIDIDGINNAVLPGGITIAAGEGIGDEDTLSLSGSTTVDNYFYSTGDPEAADSTGNHEAGTITLDGFEIVFTEFEPIIDNLRVTNRSFNIGTPGDQQIILEGDTEAGTLISDGGTGAFESLSFASPTGTFEVSAGDGNDTIIIRDLDPTFGAELSVDGGDGNDVLDAGEYDLPVTLLGGAGDDELIGGTSNDVLDGGEGNDSMDGGAGVDAVDGGGGVDDIVADIDDGAATATEFSLLSLSASFYDLVSAEIDWGDGTVDPVAVDVCTGAMTEVSASHAYATEGEYQATFSGVDTTGAVISKSFTVTVLPLIVTGGQVIVTPDGMVRVGGTEADDSIGFSTNQGVLQVSLNNQPLGDPIPLEDVTEVRVWGHGGDDSIDANRVSVPTILDGGDGDDNLTAGSVDDLIFGGLGNDKLIGGAGNDFLIGGEGADRLVGSSGHDILTSVALEEALTYDDYRDIGEAWLANKETDNEVLESSEDDMSLLGEFDRLTGGSGSDWFIIGDDDVITDIKKALKDGDVVSSSN